ncbi:MAG TPA: methylaspartate mutase, partial [Nitrospirales bacterium]|nr:methylaspartate mutase [Nitrospirales bacterium]
GEEAAVSITPARSVDVGAGKGVPVERRARGGVVGLVLDGRGRPLQLPPKESERVRALKEWHKALNLYPS